MSNANTGRIVASPLARRLAGAAKVSLAHITGSGPRGRIIKRDIDGALAGQRNVGSGARADTHLQVGFPAPQQSPRPTRVQALSDAAILQLYEEGSFEVVPHDGMRRAIAERVLLSKQTIPHFYLSLDVRVDELVAARKRINAGGSGKTGPDYDVSINDFLIKALGLALQDVPEANATWTEGGLLRHKSSDVGVAVAVEGGLYTPVVRRTEQKPLSDISFEMKLLAKRARARKLVPQDYQGGTTAISNLGMYGIKRFDGVINPPHATLLAVGQMERRPIVVEDQVEAATMMSCTLCCDHRVLDGAAGGALLTAFKGYVSDPVGMLL